MSLNQEKLQDRLVEKYSRIIESRNAPKLKNDHQKRVMAQLIENHIQESKAKNSGRLMMEDAPSTTTKGVANWDPVLISMLRRAVPQTIAFDVLGVQAMSMPTGLVFALKSRYISGDPKNPEALFQEADTSFSGTGTHKPLDQMDIIKDDILANTGSGFEKEIGEMLSVGEGESGKIKTMGLTVEKIPVEAKTRKLAASYSIELAQDLKAVHGLDAADELTSILSREIIAEENREVIRKIYGVAKIGGVGTKTPGVFNLDQDSDGQWQGQKFRALLFQIEKEANQIALETRRGRGNIIICSPNVASALSMSGYMSTANDPTIFDKNLDIDPTVNTFVGVLQGRYRVYIDPYSTLGTHDFFAVLYKGPTDFDAGIFYAPYQPLQMFETTDVYSFQPRIGFQSRYGIVQNPLGFDSVAEAENWVSHKNSFYRIVKVEGLSSEEVKP